MTLSSTSSSGSSLIVNGIISGIDTTQVIQALLQSYATPITDVQNQQTSLNSQASDYKTLNSDMQSVLTAAQALSTSLSWNLMTASTSNSDIATAVSSPGAQPGTLAFTVNNLAQGNVVVSSGGASSANATVTSASSLLVATGAAAVGFSGLSASGGLGLGSHTIDVTQSSSAATITGSNLASSTAITTGSNDELDLSVGGVGYSLTIPPNTYSPSAALAAALNAAAQNANAPISATLNASGDLQLSTTEQGSDATLSVTGGSALSALGLTSGASATGSDAIVTVDGTSTTLSSINANQVVELDAPTGAVSATVGAEPSASGALIGAGTVDAAVVSTGNGSLSNVVSGINNSGLGITATVIQDESGSSRLQISADSTGLQGEATIDSSALASGPLSSLTTITDAQDASISVGGAGGYTLTSSTDTFSNLMAGTAITVSGTGTTTATVAPDASGEATQVASLVTAANQTLSDIGSLTAFDASTKTGGPLMGSAVVENLQNEIESIFASVAGTSGLGNSANVGITLGSTGSVTFNQAAFEKAFQANPQQVASLFVQGGTFQATNPSDAADVSLVYAGDNSEVGNYDVTIGQSAAPASDTGATLSGGVVTAGETLTIGSGGLSTSFTVNAGESLSTIANGLNSAFGNAGLNLTAQVANSGTQLAITSNAFGSAAQFTVSSTSPGSGTTGLGGAVANDATTYSGVDVAGSINGVESTGAGQILTAPTDDPTLNGLSLQVTTSGVSSPTSLGSFSYNPGLAQQLVTLASSVSNATNGSLTTTINGLTAEATGLNSQIANLQSLESSQQTVLQNEFATMEETLGSLKNESSSLSSTISGLSTY